MRLFVGDDWAEDHHDVEVMNEAGKVLARKRLPEGAAGMAQLYGLVGGFLGEDADAAEVIVGIETDRGPWVVALAAAGYLVFAVNPLQAARFRERHGVSGAKSDAGDAHALADMVRTDSHQLRPAAGDSPEAEGVKVLARGPEVAMGPLVSARLRERFLAEVSRIGQDGGRVAAGGGVPAAHPRGFFVEPTVVADLPPGAPLARREVPGPVLCVLPYEGEDEAVAIANGTRYGLAAAVTSGSADRAQAIARRLRAAAVSVNEGLPHGPDSPYGAFGWSGNGHSGGPDSLEDYLTNKVIGHPADQ